jgi:hypothetical protein
MSRFVYKTIRESFLGKTDDLFHLKNRGLKVIAETVLVSPDSTTVEIEISDNPEDMGPGHP